MKKLLGEVELRNSYAVYEEDGAYAVVSEYTRGQRYECRVVPEAVEYLCERAAGQSITSARAGAVLEPVAERFGLPYTYGDRLRFSGQYVLLAAVALGRATVVKEGRSYVYSFNPAASGSPAGGGGERGVQSSIAVIGFPETLEELDTELDLYWEYGAQGNASSQVTSVDLILNFDPERDRWLSWTAPRWMTQGDILFFYHTKNAKHKIQRLLKDAHDEEEALRASLQGKRMTRLWARSRRHELERAAQRVRTLQHAADLSERYSGTIFACAEISSPAEHFEEEPARYFSSRSFAPLGKVHTFANLLPDYEFADYLKVGQNTPSTPLYEREFEGIKRQLSAHNSLPDFLKRARIGGVSFRDVTQQNWPSISCSTEARFINEAQLRAYLLDFLLEELKDSGSPLLRECRCFRRGADTGLADYFVKVAGEWIPVEAKLSLLSSSETRLLEQVNKYVAIDSFYPTVGSRVGESFAASSSCLCLVADQAGIYTISNGEFQGCSFGEPAWRREELDHSSRTALRQWIEDANKVTAGPRRTTKGRGAG
jgi:hypothetical protein